MARGARSLIIAALVACAAALPRQALAVAQLGTVSFPISCAPQAQATFERGVALLHSFQYLEAEQAFDEVERQDPRCAMCHWGRAMTLYHELWDWPTSRAFSKARRELDRARALGLKTARERAYVTAADAFFRRHRTGSHTARVLAYSKALAVVHREFPEDPEAAAFYALSLVALAGEDVDRMANLRRAIDILEPLLRKEPHHPGAAHYLIHAADTPELASLGLDAARAYADIAPDSSHALHMPSHIFVRLGMWPETIASNLRAAATAAQAAREHRGDANYQLHAMDYLGYAYLQFGEEGKARELMEELTGLAGASDEEKSDNRAYFAARTALELHRWTEAAALPVPLLPVAWLGDTFRARAIGAALTGDVTGARQNLGKLRDAIRARQTGRKKQGYASSQAEPVDLAEAEAFVMLAEGRTDQAMAELQGAADREDAEGDERLGVPAREMLADLLLELKRPSDALEAYRTVLRTSPNRFDALYGAERAARLAGEVATSREFMLQFLAIVAPDGDRPEIGEIKAVLARESPR